MSRNDHVGLLGKGFGETGDRARSRAAMEHDHSRAVFGSAIFVELDVQVIQEFYRSRRRGHGDSPSSVAMLTPTVSQHVYINKLPYPLLASTRDETAERDRSLCKKAPGQASQGDRLRTGTIRDQSRPVGRTPTSRPEPGSFLAPPGPAYVSE